jgi:hypothetical protein
MDGGRARLRFAEYEAEADGVVTDDADNRLEARLARRSSFARWFSVARIAAATTGSWALGAAVSGIASREMTVVAGVRVPRESDDVEEDGEVPVPNDDTDDRLLLGLDRYGSAVTGMTDSPSGRAFLNEER